MKPSPRKRITQNTHRYVQCRRWKLAQTHTCTHAQSLSPVCAVATTHQLASPLSIPSRRSVFFTTIFQFWLKERDTHSLYLHTEVYLALSPMCFLSRSVLPVVSVVSVLARRRVCAVILVHRAFILASGTEGDRALVEAPLCLLRCPWRQTNPPKNQSCLVTGCDSSGGKWEKETVPGEVLAMEWKRRQSNNNTKPPECVFHVVWADVWIKLKLWE